MVDRGIEGRVSRIAPTTPRTREAPSRTAPEPPSRRKETPKKKHRVRRLVSATALALAPALAGGAALEATGITHITPLGGGSGGGEGTPRDGKTGGPTVTTEVRVSEQEQQLQDVAQSIEATLKMTPEELNTWLAEVGPDGKNNNLFSGLGAVEFDFPYPPGGEPSEGTAGTVDVDSEPGFIRYGHCCPPVIDNPHRFQRVPHVGLITADRDYGKWTSLAFYNGSVTVPVPGEKDAQMTLSFATSIWPNGVKIPYVWTSNLDLPEGKSLAVNENFTTNGTISTITKDEVLLDGDETKLSSKKLLAQLNDPAMVGQPIRVSFDQSDQLPGQSFSLMFDLSDAYLSQDNFGQENVAFQALVQQGVEQGMFLSPTLQTGKEIQQSIGIQLEGLKSLESVTARFPFATIGVIDGATPVKKLQPKV